MLRCLERIDPSHNHDWYANWFSMVYLRCCKSLLEIAKTATTGNA